MGPAHQVLEEVLGGLGQAEHPPSADRERGDLRPVKINHATFVLGRIADEMHRAGGVATLPERWSLLYANACQCSTYFCVEVVLGKIRVGNQDVHS